MTTSCRVSLSVKIFPVFLFLFTGTKAQAQYQYCSAQTTRGTYTVICDGYLTPAANAPLTQAKVLGTAIIDDSGAITGKATVSVGGTILTQTVAGTEIVNSDCTGNVSYATTLNGQPGPPLDITFVISDGGATIDGLSSDPGTVLSCKLKRISILPLGR
jgi:hypothetical protein